GRFAITGISPGDYVLRVSTVGYRLLTKPFPLAAGEIKEFEIALSPDVFRQSESIEVASGPFDLARQDSPSQLTLSGAEAKNLASVLADDPLRAVQALPGVVSDDDFNSRFSLRGADYRRVGLYLDDILLHSPFHTVQGSTGASGSLSIFNGDMVDELALHTGAFPARFADRTGGILDVHTREGSRLEPAVRATASASNAGAMAEGPLGKGRRGSWLAGVRKSYLEYIIRRTSSDPSLAFGFIDTQGRLSYDLGRKQNLSLSVLDGYSDLDRSSARARLGTNSIMLGVYHFTLANLGWRFAPQERFLLTSHAAFLREKYENQNRESLVLGADHYGEWVWNTNATWIWSARAPLDLGWSARRIRDAGFSDQYQFNPFAVRRLDDFRGSAWQTGGYLQQSWSGFAGRVYVAAGARWDRQSLEDAAALSPHASLAIAPRASTRVQFAWGQYAQFPELASLLSRIGNRGLLPERSNHFLAAVEQRFGERIRLRAEFYEREDRDLLFRPWFEPRLILGRIFNPPLDAPVRNSSRGYARGFEIFLQRRSANRLSGWVSYALGYARLRDGEAGVAFPADEDQRHTVNAYGSYRLRPTINLSLRWIYGSGLPIPGFFRRDGDRLYVSDTRNAVRLDSYQRTDVRINKVWPRDRWKLTLYGEVVNLMNRRNYRFDTFNGYNARTGQVSVSLNRMFPILPAVGLVVER
ncbi:MAG: TonB-dependent receptor, partial [Acidobacteria bacterium]|nr:TonB-dependent receptor [Acidobacteriota bacterium]